MLWYFWVRLRKIWPLLLYALRSLELPCETSSYLAGEAAWSDHVERPGDHMQRKRPSHPDVSANLPTSRSDESEWHQQDEQRDSPAEPSPDWTIVTKKKKKKNCHFKSLCFGVVCQQLITKILVIHRCIFSKYKTIIQMKKYGRRIPHHNLLGQLAE